MISEADAVVVGAGSFGCSVALHLSQLGMGRVALVDRFEPGSQTSPRAAGLFKSIRKNETLAKLADLSIKKVVDFEKDTGVPLPYVRSGSLMMADGPDVAEMVRKQAEWSRQWGLEIEEIDAKEASNRMPLLEDAEARTIFYTPGDVYIEVPSSMLQAYIEAGERLGMHTVPNAPVTGIRTNDGEIEAVITDEGEIRTPVVVDAAGAWARMVASRGGAALPISTVRHQLYITEPVEGSEAEDPILRFVDSSVYVRHARGGLMLGGFEPEPLVFDPADQGDDFSMDDLPLDLTPLRTMSSAVEEKLPSVHTSNVEEYRGGLFTMTPDGRFMVGPSLDVRGLWMATGCNGGGFSFSPAFGQVLAEWIVGGEPSVDMSDFHPGRFSGSSFREDELRDKAVWQYANYFDR